MAKPYLRTLGSVELCGADGQSIAAVLHQPRRLALLVCLAVSEGGGTVARDTLLGLFWPDLPESKARHALRQALHYLRSAMGPDIITQRGREVGIVPNALICDASEFVQALGRGNLPEAVQLYRGDFLPGFFLDGGTPEFERWLEDERRTLRRRAANAAWALAESHERRRNAAAAGAMARKAAELSPGDEAALRRSIELLWRVGDRAGALEAYQTFARRLHEDYGVEPSTETQELVAYVRAETSALPDGLQPPSAAPDPAPGRQPAAELGASEPDRQIALRRRATRSTLVAVGVLGLVTALYSLRDPRDRDVPAMRPTSRLRVVIEEVSDFGRGASDGFADALTAEVIGRLAGVPEIEVIPAANAGIESAVHLGTETPANYIVRSGIMGLGEDLRLSAVLLDGVSGAVVDRAVIERRRGEPVPLVTDLGAALADFVRRELGERARERQWRAAGADGAALGLVQLAVVYRERGDSLRRAGAVDAARAAFSAADSLLAAAETEAQQWDEPAVQRAELAYSRMWLLLLPPHRNAAAARGAIHVGIAHADRVLRRRGRHPGALEIRGVLSYWLWLTTPTDSMMHAREFADRAEADLRRSIDLVPTQARAWSILSALLQARGSFGEAYWAAERAYAADTYLEDARDILVRLFNTSIENRDWAAATRWCEDIDRRFPRAWIVGHCKLSLLAWAPADDSGPVRQIWPIIDSVAWDEANGAAARARLEMIAAVILARAERMDSAAVVVRTARARGLNEPELLVFEAWARTALHQPDSAAALLARYAETFPHTAESVIRSRRFRDPDLQRRLASLIRGRRAVAPT